MERISLLRQNVEGSIPAYGEKFNAIPRKIKDRLGRSPVKVDTRETTKFEAAIRKDPTMDRFVATTITVDTRETTTIVTAKTTANIAGTARPATEGINGHRRTDEPYVSDISLLSRLS